MTNWDLVVADLQQFYGVSDPLVSDQSWVWFYALVIGLSSIPDSRVSRMSKN